MEDLSSHMAEADQAIDQIWAEVNADDIDYSSNEENDEEDHQKQSNKEDVVAAGGSKSSAPVATSSNSGSPFQLDCYPYSFSPLLLFAPSSYFDKGYSNYNSVAQFFASTLSNVDMLHNVLYDRKNMLYEELLNFVTTNRMLVTCCIDAHFTAFQILSDESLIYYDPMNASVQFVSGDSYAKFVVFMLLKCHYGNSQHIQDNEQEYYTGRSASNIRRMIFLLWRDINKSDALPYSVRLQRVPLNLDRYVLFNGNKNPQCMSTQETGNTCYFQVYLFAVLCKVGEPSLNKKNSCIDLVNIQALDDASIAVSKYLLQFFVEEEKQFMRPLTNSNVVADFFKYKQSVYYQKVVQYLTHRGEPVPNYEHQYETLLEYFTKTKVLHHYAKFNLSGTMSSALNSKSLQLVVGCDDAVSKLALSHYYKYRAANLMFGFNTNILMKLRSFCSFNSFRKNQLLAFYEEISPMLIDILSTEKENKYRDYYFMPQYEVGQQELVDVHHYTYAIDLFSLLKKGDPALKSRIHAVNQCLVERIFFSTQKTSDYDKFLSTKDFSKSRYISEFLDHFMTFSYFENFAGLGFSDTNPKEKDVNSLTQTVFYSVEMMRRQQHRMEYEFEKECINQMARSTLRKYERVFEGGHNLNQKYKVSLRIGLGVTYTKYNTLMHFLNVVERYWLNPDLNSIQVLGKDIRALLTLSCQKIFFEKGHNFYYYGPVEVASQGYASMVNDMDLSVSNSMGDVLPSVAKNKKGDMNQLVLTDRVYEFQYLKDILIGVFTRAGGHKIKTDNMVLNLLLLSLMLDFGLYAQYASLLHLPFLQSLQRGNNTKQLQVEVSNWIHEFDKKNVSDSVTRLKVEELLFEVSYKFMVNKNFDVRSKEFLLIRELSADPVYYQYVLLCKVYMSLCQINKSAEVDYYKIKCNGEFRIIIPQNFSKTTSDYLDEITKCHTFSEHDGFISCSDLRLFDVRSSQPEIHLYKVRIDPADTTQSMVKYVEISNVFRAVDNEDKFLAFIAGNALHIDVAASTGVVTVSINQIIVKVATIFFNKAISFVPCFKYADSEDVLLFTSKNVHYLVDSGGQFNPDYYGMRHELIECINSEEVFVDLNDEHVFKQFKLSELLTESKTVFYFPDYLLQVQSRQQLINLLDLAIYIRNISFFILVLFHLRRASIRLEFIEKEAKIQKISGPWKEAILYVLNVANSADTHYDQIFSLQFFDLNKYEDLPLADFVDVLCENFTKYQRYVDGGYQIVPTQKQKEFLQRIIKSEECFHFSEVGSGKTKVILPLLCQTFLSNNTEAHNHFARGGQSKNVLVILVPEHLVPDAKSQVFRYCLALNFREEYRVYDDIFALLHDNVQLRKLPRAQRIGASTQPQMKQIFITSFNQFKKALTYDAICAKVWPARENILCVIDEVDDFLDRDKLVFNICSNKSNAFDKPTLERYFAVSRSVYKREKQCPAEALTGSPNESYWTALFEKFGAINVEIMDASRSINKSFGIFNENSLRHCSSNIAQDVEGYKSLIARPYESVNRAMPGSFYSDVERTIYLTYYILVEDVSKYDELFQQERKFISFEYYNEYIRELDYDDLVYGHEKLSELVEKHPVVKDGLTRFLYEIILRRMEIRDKSRSVNSIDVVFNFDCVGFTGTPFIDNYPTFAYIRGKREDKIPDMIDRSFYVHACETLSPGTFEERFTRFQGRNSNVLVEYVSSDFISVDSSDEMSILEHILKQEDASALAQQQQVNILSPRSAAEVVSFVPFNVVVDLCGIFKRSSIHQVRDLLLRHYGPDRFLYLYHIDQSDSSDRVLCMQSDDDVAFDEEFYKHLCHTYGSALREKIFFFVDNRNVIGKDVPFQLVYQKHFGLPMFTKNVVLAHDVNDFSKIWQAMGRSRTMNDTLFTIYKSGMSEEEHGRNGSSGAQDIKKFALTRQLYVNNCDMKMAGNLSSIYQTLISLCNLSNGEFYYCDEIVNPFLEKMLMTLSAMVKKHERNIRKMVLESPMSSRILSNILLAKFSVSADAVVANEQLTPELVKQLLHHIIQQKYEERAPSNDIFDAFICFLSGEQNAVKEISYSKQQQKQKQKQQNKNQDSDTMEVFDKAHQLHLHFETDNYFNYTLTQAEDIGKTSLNMPIPVPIFSLSYCLAGEVHHINIYPTVMFLYSHHVQPQYITKGIKSYISTNVSDVKQACAAFLETVDSIASALSKVSDSSAPAPNEDLATNISIHHIRQNPQYTLVGLKKGVYVIGMKDQFNIHDMGVNPLAEHVQYIADEMGFILFDRSVTASAVSAAAGAAAAAATGAGAASVKSVDSFGPYFIEQYILMEALSKQEVAQNVLDYYLHRKAELEQGLQSYTTAQESQGGGFVCWRFLMNDVAKARMEEEATAVAAVATAAMNGSADSGDDAEDSGSA